MRAYFESMWKELTPEQQEDYGRQYIDAHLARLEGAIPTASFNINPVIHAMTDALFDISPKRRYLVGGSSKLYDIHKVGLFAIITYTFTYNIF